MNYIKLTVFAIVLLSAGACTKKFGKINTNPVLVTTDIIQPSMLFTAVLKSSIFSTYENSIFKEYANYYGNESSGTIFQDRDWSASFSDYQGNLINIAEVIRLTDGKAELRNENAMARIWKVWLFHQMSDAYGDLPYSEALRSVDSVINQPEYDTQEAIYTSMLNELKVTASQLNADPSLPSFGDADLLFSGNTDSWIRFANSLRLRLAIRVRYADEELAQQHINDVIAAPLIDNNTLNAKLATLDGSDVNNMNPLYNEYVNSNAYPVWVGFTVTQELLKRNDPRLPIFSDLPNVQAAGYRGRPMSILGTEKTKYGFDSTARLPLFFQEPVYNIIVMNTAEVYFLRAEAALAGISSEDAEEMYREGISASLEQYNVSETASTDYLGSSEGSLTSGTQEEKLEKIIVQKYLAMYHQGTEAWAEFRRTGYPKIWTGSDLGSTNGNIPRRLTYPQSEYSLNNDNVTEAAGRLSEGDKMLSRIWWDAKPGLPYPHPNQGIFPPEIY